MTAASVAPHHSDYEQLWYTRCFVPAASGAAFRLGLLSAAFAAEGIVISALQDAPPELSRHHFDHELVGLFREGGNIPAIAARAAGAPTRLIGLTWIEEAQWIVVRGDSAIAGPADLKGRRIGIPAWGETPTTSFTRGMALHGFQQALQLGGLALDDVKIVEIPTGSTLELTPLSGMSLGTRFAEVLGIDALLSDRLDAVYGKGPAFAELVSRLGLSVAVDLDALRERRMRVNNGTPRPITVHERLLSERPDLVTKFLVASLRASDWAVEHPTETAALLQEETFSGSSGIATALGSEFHRHLHPDLSGERLELLEIQKQFLHAHGFLRRDFDLEGWVAREPLEEARALTLDAMALDATAARVDRVSLPSA